MTIALNTDIAIRKEKNNEKPLATDRVPKDTDRWQGAIVLCRKMSNNAENLPENFLRQVIFLKKFEKSFEKDEITTEKTSIL